LNSTDSKMIDLSEFKKVSKAEWAEKASIDLKGKNLIDLDWELFQSIKAEAYYNDEENSEYEYVTDFFLKRNVSEWKLYEKVLVNDEKEANQLALEALSNGCDGVIFEFFPESNIQTSQLFEGIITEICDVSFSGDLSAHVQSQLTEYTNSNNKISGIDFTEKINLKNFRNTIISDCNSDSFISTCNIIRKYIEHLNAGKIPSEIVINLIIGNNFYAEIIRIRAIRLLCELINKEILTSEEYQSVHIHAKPLIKKELDTSILSNTTSGLAAIVAGVESIEFELISDKSIDFNHRISRNTGNILREESKLNFSQDPIAGNYFIDRLTHLLSESIWKNIS